MNNTLWEPLIATLGPGQFATMVYVPAGVVAAIGSVDAVDVVLVALRAIIIYVVTLLLVRVGSKRILGKASAFDVVVAIMLGSVMSRAINGSAPLLLTLVAGAALIGLHGLFGFLAFHAHWFGQIVKGKPILLIKDGQIEPRAMRRASLSAADLAEALRLHGELPDPAKIQLAYLERDGRVSVIPCKPEPRILAVSIENGVPTVRIELAYV